MVSEPADVQGASTGREVSTPTVSPTTRSSPRRSAEELLGAAPGEQIAAAIASERWARAADLLALNGERLVLDGEHEALVGWLDALPGDHIGKSARLGVLHAWVLVYAQRYQEALARLSQAERTLQAQELAEAAARRRGDATSDELELEPHAELQQSMRALRAHLASLGADPGKIPDAVEDIMLPASADHPAWRACALLTLGRCRAMAGDLRGAREDLEAARTVAGQARGPRATRTAADAGVLLGRVAEARGALGEARRLYEEVIAQASDARASAAAAVGLASVALWRNDRAAARAALARLDAAPSDVDAIAVGFEGGLARAALLALDGQHDEARAALDAAEKELSQRRLRWPLDHLQVQRVRLALLRGDDSSARRWVQAQGLDRAGEASRPLAALERATQALVLLRTDARAALEAAARAMSLADETGHRLVALEALVLTGLASHAVGLRDDARSALVQALEAASVEGVARPFLVRAFDGVAEELRLEGPFVHALREAARALPPPSTSVKERPAGGRVAVGTLAPGPIETRHPVSPEPAAAPASEPVPAPAPGVPEPDPG